MGQPDIEEVQKKIYNLSGDLQNLAMQGNPLAAFSYAQDIYQALRSDKIKEEPEQLEFIFQSVFELFLMAANEGVYNAHFYLGMIFYEGIFVDQDIERAMDHYIKGAAKNNAFCYFELSRIYDEGVYEQKSPGLKFLYLKRSAEEGFLTAQHMLGIAYHEGSLVKKNDKKALAWFRESVRNGFTASYLNAGELLNKEGDMKNRLFALVNYLGAYQHGAFFLEDTIKELR